MNEKALKYWIALKMVEGVGNVGFVNLVKTCGSPEQVFEAPLGVLKETPGIGQKTALQIKSFSKWDIAERELETARKEQVKIIPFLDHMYPESLLNIYDYPPLLYVKGALRQEDIYLAFVGSRAASAYGKYTTERLCRELAMKSITIVSGLARGIDTAAHRGSLAARGRTIAVLGCGLDVVYPPENKELYDKISLQGALITEFPFGTPPHGANFPARNRIISGLSFGVVVVEANEKSGSLITARLALEQGREVFAVPGAIDAAGSKGTNKLIKQGAKLVENIEDILEEIRPQLPMRQESPVMTGPESSHEGRANDLDASRDTTLTDLEKQLLDYISAKPVGVDYLIAQSGGKTSDILNSLLLLELKGLIRQLPGKMFIQKEP